MSIKAGQILHVAGGFVLDRIQTGGAGNLNIPQERVYELGNYQSVGIVRDIPDLTFSLDTLDVGTEIEALLAGSTDPGSDADGTQYDYSAGTPIDIISPWKSPYGAFGTVRGVAIPQLTLESVSYKYGLKDNAGETFQLRGDAIYYIPGAPYRQVEAGDGLTTTFNFDHTALLYVESGDNLYALNVAVDGVRQKPGDDYTETSAGIEFVTAPDSGAVIAIVYGSATLDTHSQAVHEGLSVKPAAIKGKDIDVYFSTDASGSEVEVRWTDVQSFSADWRATIEDDFEFGNPKAVNRDYTDVPAVTGTVELKPRSVEAWFTRLQQITGLTSSSQVIGPGTSITGALRVELRNPESGGTTAVAAGTPLKTLYIPSARFTIPGYEGRVQQKLTATVNFESDDGVMYVYKGEFPWAS